MFFRFTYSRMGHIHYFYHKLIKFFIFRPEISLTVKMWEYSNVNSLLIRNCIYQCLRFSPVSLAYSPESNNCSTDVIQFFNWIDSNISKLCPIYRDNILQTFEIFNNFNVFHDYKCNRKINVSNDKL